MKNQTLQDIENSEPLELKAYSVGLLQGTAYSRLHKQLTIALFEFFITIPEWKLLGQLHENRKLKLSALADLLSYDPPMVTKLVKRLEKRGMVKREQDRNDERSKIIQITAEGDSLIEKAEPEVKKTIGALIDGVTNDELKTYIKVLSRIVQNSKKLKL